MNMKIIKKWTKKWLKIKQEVSEMSEQQKAERFRKKQNKLKNMKDGTKKNFLIHFDRKSNPLVFMKDEYSRRKYERNNKYNKTK